MFLRFIFVCLLVLKSIMPVTASQKEIPSDFHTPQNAPILLRDHGYVLFDIDVGGKAPSFEFVQLKLPRKSRNDEKPIYILDSDKYQTGLKDLDNGMYVLALEAGLYQVTSINAPFFDLPYILDTKSKHGWRFSVHPNAVSYAGKLVIEQERGTNFINVNLLKRFAMDQQAIEQVAEEFFPQVPLKIAYGTRDDFYPYLQQLKSTEEMK